MSMSYNDRVEQDVQWIYMLNYDKNNYLSELRNGNLHAVILLGQQYYRELADQIRSRNMEIVPLALRCSKQERENILEAIRENRIKKFDKELLYQVLRTVGFPDDVIEQFKKDNE
jgi:hypothetical protein